MTHGGVSPDQLSPMVVVQCKINSLTYKNISQALFVTAFEATRQFQDQAEKIGTTMMGHAYWLPGESRKRFDSCVDAYNASRANFKSCVDEGYRQSPPPDTACRIKGVGASIAPAIRAPH